MAQGALIKLKAGDRLTVRVIDGCEPQLVEVWSPQVTETACERHCACHGGGPFYCCRCGAMFTIVEG